MGYTNYWRGWVTLSETFVSDVEAIIEASDVVIKGGDGFGLPTLEVEDEIVFNGTDQDDESHETFRLVNGVNHTEFCKTARKPYDEVVGAVLLRASRNNKRFKVRSDGDWEEDWKSARALYAKTFGEEATKPEEMIESYAALREKANA